MSDADQPSDDGSGRFDALTVLRKAEDLARRPYHQTDIRMPQALVDMSYDEHSAIRFLPEQAIRVGTAAAPFELQMHHPGWIFRRPVLVNVVRSGFALRIPYSKDYFEFGETDIGDVGDVGYAGFKIIYPLNEPHKQDEVMSFLGASYFRFIGPGHRYGLSARGLAIGTGEPSRPEEFPEFREFWVEEATEPNATLTIHALLDSPSLTGAYRFALTPRPTTTVEVEATIFTRRDIARLGVAPLTSMYFTGPGSRRITDDFRPEVHDSDLLLIHNSQSQWLARPLRNAPTINIASFNDEDPGGFGLLQRARDFESYQDIEAEYHRRPSYWVEPQGQWGKGAVTLVELPEASETEDNIVAFWAPENGAAAGAKNVWRYRMRALEDGSDLHDLGHVLATHYLLQRANGGVVRRFIIDFAGGDLPYVSTDEPDFHLEVTASNGQVRQTTAHSAPEFDGIRVEAQFWFEDDATSDVFVLLRRGESALTEQWVYTHSPVELPESGDTSGN